MSALTCGQARHYLEQCQAAVDLEPCEHGHLGCALYDGGPCTDELCGQYGLDGDGEPQCGCCGGADICVDLFGGRARCTRCGHEVPPEAVKEWLRCAAQH